jgi:hypothetical protein
MGYGREDVEALQQGKKTAGDVPRSWHFNPLRAGFAAVVHTAGVRRYHLFKIIPLCVCGLKTFWTIVPREVSSCDG